MNPSFLDATGCPKYNEEMSVFDWLSALPQNIRTCNLVEVQFKHTRKEYFANTNNLPLRKGDIVAVEATPGHDIGEVTLTGDLVMLQIKKIFPKEAPKTFKQVFRKATPADMEKCQQAKEKEHKTMLQARKIAEYLGLDMKIGDVEFQGDGNKAIFYYIADGRVDFRELIKFLAQEFKVRIEMRQIGVRQEAGKMGGIGPCGRPLCCSSWLRNFYTVTTNSARTQDLSTNVQKLTGQCTKLKCCLHFELDTYIEAQKKLPSREVVLQTKEADYYFFKADVLKQMITYSTSKESPTNLVTIPVKKVFEIIEMNKKGGKPEALASNNPPQNKVQRLASKDLLGQENISRFATKNNSQGGKKEAEKTKKKEAKNSANYQGKPVKSNPKAKKKTNAPLPSPPASDTEKKN